MAVIFSLYFALLAILPCQDREDMIASAMHVTIKNKRACSDQKGQETCPPFCSCSCCSTARVLTGQSAVKLDPEITLRSKYPQPAVPALLEQSLAIWQPPQIA